MKKYRLYILSIYLITNILFGESKIYPVDGVEDDRFGQSVLLADSWLFVGANRDFHEGINSGSVYVYTYDDNLNSSYFQKIIPNDSSNDQFFGKTISYSDGWLAVSAIYDAQYGYKSGAVYLFYFNGNSWEQHTKITAFDASSYDRFGYSIDIENDYLIIGSIYDDVMGENSGSAYYYKYEEDNWILLDKICPDYLESNDLFGHSVSISDDYFAISAPQSDLSTPDGGVVNLYNINEEGYIDLGLIIPNDLNTFNNFGYKIYIESNFMFISAIYDDDLNINAGSVYVYEIINNEWVYYDQLYASDGYVNDNFGISLSFFNNWLSVGSLDDDNGIDSGSLYLYQNVNNAFVEKMKISSFDGDQYDEFSSSVSIKDNYLLVGSRLDDDNGNNSGAAYFYQYKGCNDVLACNYYENLLLNDSMQCEYPINGYECNGDCLSVIDDCGICGGGDNNGDANIDNTVNIIDVIIMIEYIFNISEIDNICIVDINNNGVLNITDIILVIESILSN